MNIFFWRKPKKAIKTIYFIGFIFAIVTAFPAYIQSSFIETFVGLQWVGIFFIGAMILSLILIIFFPFLINKITNYKLAVFVLLIHFLSIIFIIFNESSVLLFVYFIIFIATSQLAWINIDLFLESFTSDSKTGKIRGTFFTIMNLGWLISPLLAGYIVQGNNYRLAFLVASLCIIPVLMTLIIKRKQLKDSFKYKNHHILKTLKCIFEKSSLKRIFYIAFLLHLFYTIAVIYLPIYLHKNIGFDWSIIGIIFTVMLLPFVLLQLPAGILADKFFGEKEMLIIGFIILSLSLVLIFYVKSNVILLWALILFLSRCGAALIEIMRETYFFKIVDVKDAGIIDFFRINRPLAYLIGTGLGVLVIKFLSIEYLFIMLAIIMLTGIYTAIRLKDTK